MKLLLQQAETWACGYLATIDAGVASEQLRERRKGLAGGATPSARPCRAAVDLMHLDKLLDVYLLGRPLASFRQRGGSLRRGQLRRLLDLGALRRLVLLQLQLTIAWCVELADGL